MTVFHRHVYMLSFPNNNIIGDMWLCHGYDQKETRINFPGKHESMRKTTIKKTNWKHSRNIRERIF